MGAREGEKEKGGREREEEVTFVSSVMADKRMKSNPPKTLVKCRYWDGARKPVAT